MFGAIGLPEMIILMMLGVCLGLYFLPKIVGIIRKKKNVAPFVLVNILLGWSVIGWIVAMVWALATIQPITLHPSKMLTSTIGATFFFLRIIATIVGRK